MMALESKLLYKAYQNLNLLFEKMEQQLQGTALKYLMELLLLFWLGDQLLKN